MKTPIFADTHEHRGSGFQRLLILLLTGCLSTIYAFGAVIVLLHLGIGGVSGVSHMIRTIDHALPFFAAIAFGLTSMLFWQVLVFRRQQWTLKRGLLVGFLSALCAHPFMWVFYLIYTARYIDDLLFLPLSVLSSTVFEAVSCGSSGFAHLL